MDYNDAIAARESVIMLILSAKFAPDFRLKYNDDVMTEEKMIRDSIVARLRSEIVEIKRRMAPAKGPFKIRSREKIGGHFLYLQSVSNYNPTQHSQDAKVWKTAAGAEKALRDLDTNFCMASSFEIVPE